MRQYGSVPPWLSTAVAPFVELPLGLGAGGGASVFTADGQGFGDIYVQTGSNPASNGGGLALSFPQAPPLLFISADDEFGVINIGGQQTLAVTIGWTAQLPPNRKLRIHYEWAVSK